MAAESTKTETTEFTNPNIDVLFSAEQIERPHCRTGRRDHA